MVSVQSWLSGVRAGGLADAGIMAAIAAISRSRMIRLKAIPRTAPETASVMDVPVKRKNTKAMSNAQPMAR